MTILLIILGYFGIVFALYLMAYFIWITEYPEDTEYFSAMNTRLKRGDLLPFDDCYFFIWMPVVNIITLIVCIVYVIYSILEDKIDNLKIK